MQPGGIGDCLIRRFLVVLDIETITDPREGPQEARDKGQLDANATPWDTLGIQHKIYQNIMK
jgi:hypothetical protein